MRQLFWNYGGEGVLFSGLVSAIGSCLTGFLGGFDQMVQALICLMVLDFLLGFLAAIKAGHTDSHVMFWGGINKILVLILVGVGVVLDGIIGLPEPYVRTAIIWFYIGREGLSIVENYGKMGLPLPEIIKNTLAQMKEKGE